MNNGPVSLHTFRAECMELAVQIDHVWQRLQQLTVLMRQAPVSPLEQYYARLVFYSIDDLSDQVHDFRCELRKKNWMFGNPERKRSSGYK